jgi:BioD-like phosphotransacetylase family protein
VTKTVPYLLVGSVESYSGKSTTILGLIHQLQQKGLNVAYGKPLGTFLRETESGILDEDGEFVAQMLRLSPPNLSHDFAVRPVYDPKTVIWR